MHLEVLKRFLIFKIDMHTPGTQKNEKSPALRVKKMGKNMFFQHLWLYFVFGSIKIPQTIIYIISDMFVERFYLNRP